MVFVFKKIVSINISKKSPQLSWKKPSPSLMRLVIIFVSRCVTVVQINLIIMYWKLALILKPTALVLFNIMIMVLFLFVFQNGSKEYSS